MRGRAIIAQSQVPELTIVWLVLGMIIFLLFAAVVVLLLRKHLLGSARDDASGTLTLHDLRTMRDEGRLTDEEYDRARAVILGRHAASPAPARPNAPPAPAPDELRARPGYDLTGRPLPTTPPGDEGEAGSEEEDDEDESGR